MDSDRGPRILQLHGPSSCSQEDDVDIHALRRRGWSISAIARHVGRDRRRIRAYLDGRRRVGVPRPVGDDAFAGYLEYCTLRLAEDPRALHMDLASTAEGAGSYGRGEVALCTLVDPKPKGRKRD